MANSSTDSSGSFGGCLVLFIIVIAAGSFIYERYFASKTQPVVISLSAYFVDNAGNPITSKDVTGSHLKIKGDVHVGGKALDTGTVRLTVRELDDSFQQAISTDIKAGHFEIDDPSLRTLLPIDKLHIRADVSAADPQNPINATENLYLNSPAPTLSQGWIVALWIIALGLLVLILAAFFMTFTGQRTPQKNRNAIIFSYLVSGVFLAVPLLAPIFLLQFFPNVQREMVGMPVGLVLTRVGGQPDAKNQWALNIGGYSRIPSLAEKSELASNAAIQASPSPSPSPRGAARPTPRNTPSPTPTTATGPQATPNASPNASPVSSPSPGPAQAASTPSTTTEATIAHKVAEQESEQTWDGVVVVEGGLVIPLYVIILSVIGGAINMTRKVPRFQGEGEYSEPTTLPSFNPLTRIRRAASSVSNYVSAKIGTAKKEVEASNESKPQAADQTIVEEHGPQESQAALKAGPATPQPDAKTKVKEKTDSSAESEEPSVNDQAKAIDLELDKLVKDQLTRNSEWRKANLEIRARVQKMQKLFDDRTDDQRILEFESFDAWLANRVSLKEALGTNWRVELLNQYMYLISAPFLAIVAYYMLDLLGLNKQPVLVLISFSVGLISERILSWLLGLASGYLRSNSKTQPAGS
jgi:hypothetical protein